MTGMIWYLMLLALIAAACILFARRERIKPWPGSPRTTRTDKAFLWEYEISSGRRHRRPVASRLGISASIPFAFAVEQERWTHRLSKWFGFCEEFQTEDNDFDQHVFIISDDKLFQQKLQNNIELHQLIVRAFAQGARKIYSSSGYLIIQLKEIQPEPHPDMAESLTALLYDIKRHLGSSVAPPQEHETRLPTKLIIGKALPVFLLMAAMVTLIINLVMGFTIIDWEPMWPLLRDTSIAAILGILIAIYGLFHNSSYGHEVLMRFLAIGSWSTVLASLTVLWFVNCQYDASEPQVYNQPALEKYTTRSKRVTHYHIRIANWHRPEKTIAVDVPYNLYASIRIGDQIRIFARPGYLGMEWISKIEQRKHKG